MLDTQAVWERVLRDVRRTTSLDLRIARCDGAGGFLTAFVVWRAGEPQPQPPIETQWLDEELSYVVVRDDEDEDGDRFAGSAVVDSVQDLVQMSLYAAGEDPTWPRCPDHGTHPLQVHVWSGTSSDAHLEWRCLHGHGGHLGTVDGDRLILGGFNAPVGTLTRPDAPDRTAPV